MNRSQQIAWFAGLYEGEGSLALAGREKQRAYIQIDMTDQDVVERCHALFGGTLYGPVFKNSGFNIKPMFQWRLNSQENVWNLLDEIYPYLGERRRGTIDAARVAKEAFVDRRFSCVSG